MSRKLKIGELVKFTSGPWVGRTGEVSKRWNDMEYSVRIDPDDPSGPTMSAHIDNLRRLPKRRNENVERISTRLDEGVLDVLKGIAKKIKEFPMKMEGVEVVYDPKTNTPFPAPKGAEDWSEEEVVEYLQKFSKFLKKVGREYGQGQVPPFLKQLVIGMGRKGLSFDDAAKALLAENRSHRKTTLVEMVWGKNEGMINEVDCQSPNVELNKVRRDSTVKNKKFSVCVKDGDSVKKVSFGDPDMNIRKSDDEARKSFRARHNCDNPGPKTKARYWACKTWEKGFDLP